MAPRILSLFSVVGVLVASVACCTPRPARELVEDPSFEAGGDAWTGNNNPVLADPAYPAHSGTHVTVLNASYVKAGDTAPISVTSFTSQLVSAIPPIAYTFKAYYNVVSLSKGASCPDASLPLGSCKLTITYAFQNIQTIVLTQTTGYIEVSSLFLPSTGGRYIQFSLSCAPTTATPQCAETTVLLDDVTFTDAGNDCSWRYWGCFTDNVNSRSLPYHGTIDGWPATTTIETCTNACQKDGYWYAGLEYGNECWCGNGLGGNNVTDGCTMSCSGASSQICGGPDRLSVYHQGVWES